MSVPCLEFLDALAVQKHGEDYDREGSRYVLRHVKGHALTWWKSSIQNGIVTAMLMMACCPPLAEYSK